MTYGFLAPLMTGYGKRSTRAADRHADVCRRLCEARQHDSVQPETAGGSPTAARTPSRSPATAKAKKDGGDDDGGDGDGVPELAHLVNTLIERIAAMSRPAIPVEIDLWDADTIGSYLKRSASVVRERIVCQPSFPAAIRLPNSNGQRMHPLWKAREVINWAESYREHKTTH
jgi:hypothetical protein